IIMTITAIIKRLGAERSFSVNGSNGMQKTVTAIEMELQSGSHLFVGECYDEVASYVKQQCQTGDTVVAELAFSTREATTRDGGKFVSQKVNINAMQNLSPHF
ncbi:MAG: hypothetical protein K6B13_11180, partial [Prevotella sp.]|nr:hypothetical protein [Prevotella sp.]